MVRVQETEWWTAFDGVHVLDNTLRLGIIFTGILLTLLCVRFAYIVWRRGERYRVLGIAAFGCFVFSPTYTGLLRFDQPLLWGPAIVYTVGLVLAFAALWANYHIAPTWWRLSLRRSRRPERRHGD